MAVNGLYEVRVYYHLPDAEATVAFQYIQTAGGNDNETLESAIDFWITNILPLFVACLAVDVAVDQVRMDQVSLGDELPAFTNLTGTPGVMPGQALPAGGAAVISWVTDAPNAKHNGRFYLAGVSEDDIDDGNISVAQLFAMNALADKLQETLLTSLPQDAEFSLATISRVLNGAPRIPPVGFLVNSHFTRLPFFSQRRRITKRLGLS